MHIYPAIDMKKGRAVRLFKGLETEVTDYGDPVEAARRWMGEGAQFLHLVDLDGSFQGEGKNLAAVEKIAALQVPTQLGGGIRSMEDIKKRFDLGVSRVILGTVAVENPDLVKAACKAYPGRIVCGIDAKNGMVAVKGWVETTSVTALELALRMRDAGVTTVVYTDISKDSTMQGPNLLATQELIEKTGMQIIGSGGVGSLNDLGGLKQIGCEGAIVGKALYEGRFTLQEALQVGGIA